MYGEWEWAGLHIYHQNFQQRFMSEHIELFRAITNDHTIQSAEISKFLKWGNGNLEQALNYYFRQKEKESKAKPTPPPPTRSKTSSDAFSKIKEGMVKQQRTKAFISKVREEYKLPIKGRSSLESNSQSLSKMEEGMDMDIEFAEADYLPEIFNQRQGSFEEIVGGEAVPVYRNQNRRENSVEYEQQKLDQPQPEEECQKTQKSKIKEPQLNPFKIAKLAKQQQQSRPKFEYAYDVSEYYLGEIIVDAFAIRDEFKLELPEGTPLQFRYYMQQPKKKKGFKSNKDTQKVMNMRIVGPNGQFGRLKDQEVKIFLPLIVHGMLRLELASHYIPKRTQYYTPLKLKAKIYLLKRAVTEPVVETFEGHSDMIVSVYKAVAEETLSLFDRLQLPVKTWPLIKRKSKLKLREQSIMQKRQEHNTNREIDEESRRLKELEERQRNDPLLKITQKSLADMFRSKVCESSPEPKQHQVQQKSAVKRVILELKTIEEDKCAQLVDLYQEDLQPIKPSSNFISQLFDYQARALAWMMQRQGHQQAHHREKEELHPLWIEFELPQGQRMFLNQLTSQVSVKPPMSKAKCLGGILADEMGLGKTVMMAALMASADNTKDRKKNEGRNLVIVPLTLLSQWEAEIKRHTKNIKAMVYYGDQRKNLMNSLHSFDVVITTYGIVSNQFSKGGHLTKTGLYRLRWQRIILDEAHYIKGRVIQTAKAVYELDGLYRWCLTGTPIQNNLTDLFSLVHFIRYTPWAEYECWNKYINRPSEAGDENVYEVLRTILKRVFLRRTKQTKDHMGRPIVTLPTKVSRIQLLQMNEKERQFYDSIYECSRSTIEELDRQGILEARYMQVFEILIKLRQICCHPMLYKSAAKYITENSQFQAELRKFIKKRESANEQGEKYYEPMMEGDEEIRVEVTEGKAVSQLYIKEIVAKVERGEMDTCPVCLGEVEDPVVTSCLHIFCRTCAIRQIQQCGICSACRRRLSREDFILLPRENRFNINLNDKEKYYRSSKIQALLDRLLTLGPDDKVVVFSQFLGMLDLIEHQLKLQGFAYVRMEGSTSHKDRTKIVEKFQKDPTIKIFIVSLKTAGVGLNLVAANKVFLMDPWWNPGVQDQAIERVHRIGQLRQVQIVRFIMDRSIEMRMMELNTNKKQLSQKVLSQQGGQAENKVEKLRYLMERY